MPGVTLAQKSITVDEAAMCWSALLLYIAAVLSQYIVHNWKRTKWKRYGFFCQAQENSHCIKL